MRTAVQIFLFVLTIGLVLGGNQLVHVIIHDINRSPDITRRYHGQDARAKFYEFLRVHSGLFPDSKLRRAIVLLFGFGFAAVLICFGLGFLR